MIVKVTAKEKIKPGEYFHEMFIEADRIEIQFHKDQPTDDPERDWSYFDGQAMNETMPVYVIRSWQAYPQQKFEVGYVWGGRIFLINDSGKTIDKYTL